ncbi:MAG: 16S rRNA (cytosine(967)-C(5))-methyltransferase RsmB, partial [Acinetobacter sp.]
DLQQQILNHMWQQLKVGGTLLYITCSILKVENEQQMVNFFAEHPDAVESKIEASWGIEQIHGRQLLPETGHGDGFYYCRIQKIA